MEYKVILYHDAEQDIREIVKWYDLKSVELSNRFIFQLDEAISLHNLLQNRTAVFIFTE